MSARSTILVVDDDADVAASVADALEAEGYRVVQASGGREALRILVEEDLHPAMILLDLMMPDMNGWAFRAEQQRVPEIAAIPVLLFTATSIPEARAQELAPAALLRKPIRLEELLAAIVRVEGHALQ
jgi:CheY-like chemotaxis protein